MVDEIATAKVEINVNRDGGPSVAGSSSKKDSKNIEKTAKSMEGLFKLVKKGGGTFAAILGAASLASGAVTAGTIGGADVLFNLLKDTETGDMLGRLPGDIEHIMQPGGYAKVWEDGVEKVAKINEITGQIDEVISMREASERGILNELNDIKSEYQTHNNLYGVILKVFETYKGDLILTSENEKKVLSQTAQEVRVREEIQRELEKKRDRLAAANNSGAGSKYTHYTPQGQPYSADEPGTFWDVVYGQQSNENTNKWADIYNATKNGQQVSFIENIFPWEQ